MKRTRGENGESTRKPRKSSNRAYPYCIFCDEFTRKMEPEKNGDEKEKEKVGDIVDLLGEEVEIRDQLVEIEIEEVSVEKPLEEVKREEKKAPRGEEENGNGINGGGGENFEDGSTDLLSPEEIAAVAEILNGLDLGGWGKWHFEDDMIWRQWEGADIQLGS